jgi:hypothetical protein
MVCWQSIDHLIHLPTVSCSSWPARFPRTETLLWVPSQDTCEATYDGIPAYLKIAFRDPRLAFASGAEKEGESSWLIRMWSWECRVTCFYFFRSRLFPCWYGNRITFSKPSPGPDWSLKGNYNKNKLANFQRTVCLGIFYRELWNRRQQPIRLLVSISPSEVQFFWCARMTESPRSCFTLAYIWGCLKSCLRFDWDQLQIRCMANHGDGKTVSTSGFLASVAGPSRACGIHMAVSVNLTDPSDVLPPNYAKTSVTQVYTSRSSVASHDRFSRPLGKWSEVH